MATTQPAPCNVRGRAMPPLRSISSRMLSIISSSSAALRSEEEDTTSNKNTTHVSGTATATAFELCDRALRVSVQQEEQQHQSSRPSAPSSQRHRRASSFLSTRSSQGEECRRSSLYSMGSTILSDLSSVADEMISSLALEAANTTDEVDQPTSTRLASSSRRSLSRNDAEKEHCNPSTATTSRPKNRRASYHYPGATSHTNRRSSCSSMLSTDSERSEIHHRHQVYLHTARRRHSSLYDIDDEHEDDDSDGDDIIFNEEVGHASDVEDIVIHRPGTSLAGNDAQESVRDLTFFEDGQFEVVDGLVTLSSSPINSVASRAG